MTESADPVIDHGARRGRALRLGFATGVAARALSIVVAFAAVPVVTDTLGQARYGAFALVAGLAALLPFSDLGLGSGLVTALGGATGRDDTREARRLVTAAFAGLVAVAAVLLVVFLVVDQFVDWARLLGLGDQPFAGEVDVAVRVFGVLFLLAVPGTLGTRVLQGLQRTHAANYWQFAAAPLVLVGYLLARAMDGGIAAFAAVAGGVPLVLGIAATAWVFADQPGLRPTREAFDLTATRQLTRLGGLFLVLTVAVAVAFETDSLVLSWVLGPDEVAVYSVTFRLFSLVTMVAALAFAPLWPAFAESLSRGDVDWAKATFRRSVGAGALAAVPTAIVLALVAQPFIRWWVGDSFVPPFALVAGLAVWVTIVSVQMPLSMLLNGAGVVRFQVVAASCMALANLALSITLAHSIGISGPVWGSVVAYVVCTGVPSVLYLRYRFTWRSDHPTQWVT